jgi:hypothetical protein
VTRYPKSLRPNSYESIELPSGRTISIPKVSVQFELWSGREPKSSYGHKAILRHEGEPAFAELVILRIFQSDGWDGRWIDNFGGKSRVGFWEPNAILPLPSGQSELLSSIRRLSGRRGGCFDVFCWHNNRSIFAEAKRKGKDRIRGSQRFWLEAALRSGLEREQFLVVEWTLA